MLLLQMVTYLHTGSNIKPRRVKTHMQMRAGRKGHKKNECRAAMMSFFYFGQELIRRETEFSLKRKGEENYRIRKGSFWSLRDMTTTLFGTNYFGIFFSPSQIDKFDLSLILEFDGLPTGPSVVKWFEKAEWVCKLFRIKEPSMVIPLRLTKGAYEIYLQLGDDADLEEIERTLYTAFGTDPLIAWKQFVGRRLEPSETVDVYLADLRRLAVPFCISETINFSTYQKQINLCSIWSFMAEIKNNIISLFGKEILKPREKSL